MDTTHKIKHLFWRAGFGCSAAEWQSSQNLSVEDAVHLLFRQAGAVPLVAYAGPDEAPSPEAIKSMSEAEKKMALKEERGLVLEQNLAWLNRMASSEHSAFLERMTLFWHGHFACISRSGRLAAAQLNHIRPHALGSFRDLVLAIARDASMIRFLNNQQNKKEQPNENFARELMELFTIGRGHYTETDVKEAARAFTGWSSTLAGEFIFRRFQHDFGQKSFMGKTGRFDGTDIIDILLEQRQTARFIAEKAYRYFVSEIPAPDRTEHLTEVFFQSDYSIAALMREIFLSDWFYSPGIAGQKVKSPADLLAGIFRQLQATIENQWGLFLVQRALGQVLFQPPNVAGWPGGRAWIDNSTLMLRLNLPGLLFQAAEVDFEVKAIPESGIDNNRLKKLDATLDFQAILQLTSGFSDAALTEWLIDFLLPSGARPDPQLLERYVSHHSREEYVKSLTLRLLSLPEYQLC